MYFKYGTFQHANNEVDIVNITHQRMYSKRNRIAFIRKTMHLQGHICQTGQDTLRTYINNLKDAYANDLKDAILYHDDGTKSSHYMYNDNAINGVRIKSYSFPKGGGAEYATGRTYSIVLEGEYIPLQGVSGIYSFSETVRILGNGGPAWELIPQASGDPIEQILFEKTPQNILQYGEVVGLNHWPTLVPTPLFDINSEHLDRRVFETSSPRKIGVNKHMLFPMKYRYMFSLKQPQVKYAAVDYVA